MSVINTRQCVSVLTGAIFILLTACTTQSNVQSMRSDKASCVMSCEQRSAQCNKTCRNSCRQCQAWAQQGSYEHFSRYAHEQYVKGGTIFRDVNAYRDPLQCRKTTCSCAADFQVCMQSCGGVIRKQLQAAPVCQ